jgi:hypothetical protein
MNMNRLAHSTHQSPLEQFLREYVSARDGIWDEVEPQVYDVLLGPDMIQVAFDPEALPEHPRAQLATFGSPLFDRLLSDAAGRWNSAAFYRIGAHLTPHTLAHRIARAIAVPAGATLESGATRAMHFPQAVFWFKATFASDQREDVVLPVGIDLSSMREARQLDATLAFERLSGEPDVPLPEAPHRGLAAGYRVSRSHAVRSLASMANARRREWSGAVHKQIERMRGYYTRLREEAAAPAGKAADPAAAAARARARKESIDREEQLRIAELRRKSELRVELKLTNLLLVYQPKLKVSVSVTSKGRPPQPLDLVWDPVTDSVEAASCPRCGQPTFKLEIDRHGLKCPSCPAR